MNLASARIDYTIEATGEPNTYRVTDTRASLNDGGDLVTGVEKFQFSDGTVAEADILANRAPVADGENYGVEEDAALTVAAAGGVLTGDADQDGDALWAILLAGPANGALTLNADGSFTYAPNANFDGSDSFTYKATDEAADSNVATVTIDVAAKNDAPAADNESYNVNEDGTLTVVTTGVLVGDADVESDPLSAVLVSGPESGALALNANGTFTYTPTQTSTAPTASPTGPMTARWTQTSPRSPSP